MSGQKIIDGLNEAISHTDNTAMGVIIREQNEVRGVDIPDNIKINFANFFNRYAPDDEKSRRSFFIELSGLTHELLKHNQDS